MKSMNAALKKELMKMQIESYDKGFNDALNGTIEAFAALKASTTHVVLSIDAIINMIEMAKNEGNKIKTTH